MQSKEDFLCVIRDKMDHFKTTLPRFQVKNKVVSELGQLLMTLIGMIVHGHGDKTFVQYFNELWPNDPNFTNGWLLCLFHNLEMELVRESWVLFGFDPQKAFFQQILQGNSHCLSALKLVDKIVGVKPLQRKLLLQMDNCVKNNKNRQLLTFLSLLITCEVFEEVQLGFLVVGHTHEDIDGSFGYLLKKLRKQNNYVMENLMKTFMLSQDHT
jgi:hypothetical protein